MNPFRLKNARVAVLEALELAGSYPLEESVLLSHCNNMVKPPMAADEWKDLIDSCEKSQLIVAVPSALDEKLRQFTVTERGLAAKRQA